MRYRLPPAGHLQPVRPLPASGGGLRGLLLSWQVRLAATGFQL